MVGRSEAAVSRTRPVPTRPRVIHISEPVYERLVRLQEERQAALGRRVPFSEVIERLLEREP